MFMKKYLPLLKDERGDGYVDVLIKMMIAIIVGAALLLVMQTAMPQLYNDTIARIRSTFMP